MSPTLPNPVQPVLRLRYAVTILVTAMTLLVVLPFRGGTQPPVSLTCVGGERLNEADLARGSTIVVVWASWSPRSRNIVERVGPLAGRWGSQARVVTVNF